MSFTEANLELAVIELLGVQGCSYASGANLDRTAAEVLLKSDLRQFLAVRYAGDGCLS